MKIRALSLITSILLSSIQIQANEFDDLLSEIENTTKIATKNNIETTYAPGIITVLKNEELKRLGIKNFYEALKLIPNVDIGMSSSGTKNIITRGIGGITGSGKTKIMINGVGQNSNASGIIHFNLPIDIIERIEVIRGPASALYGEYAFSGAINIVTKKDTNTIFYFKDSTSDLLGTTLSYNGDDLKISATIVTDDDKGFEQNNIETLREEEDFISQISYKNFKVNISLNKAKKGEFYGLVSTLPKNDGDYNFAYNYQTIELSNKFIVNSSLSLEPKIGMLKYNYIMDDVEISSNVFVPLLNGDIKYKKIYFMLDNIYSSNNYEIISGIESSTTKEINNISNNRDVHSIYLHDNIKISDKLGLNIGIRYEKYDDKSNSNLIDSILPRIASIYRYNNTNTFKFQYGEAYRPPTFLEGTTIKPETIDTYEFQHIYKSNKSQIQTTLFYSTIKNLIIITGGNNYTNKKEDIISQGIELEHIHHFNNNFLINSNISFNDTKEKDSKKEITNYSKILANISLSYLPYSSFSSTIYQRYIGSKQRENTDTRDKLKAQYSTDITFKYLPYKDNFEIVFGIKNIFDKDTRVSSNTIQDDLIYEERNYFIGVNYKF